MECSACQARLPESDAMSPQFPQADQHGVLDPVALVSSAAETFCVARHKRKRRLGERVDIIPRISETVDGQSMRLLNIYISSNTIKLYHSILLIQNYLLVQVSSILI